jgi:hypothetical protein
VENLDKIPYAEFNGFDGYFVRRFEVFIPEPTKVWQKAELKEYPVGTEFRVMYTSDSWKRGDRFVWHPNSSVSDVCGLFLKRDSTGVLENIHPHFMEVLA